MTSWPTVKTNQHKRKSTSHQYQPQTSPFSASWTLLESYYHNPNALDCLSVAHPWWWLVLRKPHNEKKKNNYLLNIFQVPHLTLLKIEYWWLALFLLRVLRWIFLVHGNKIWMHRNVCGIKDELFEKQKVACQWPHDQPYIFCSCTASNNPIQLIFVVHVVN